MTVDNSTEQWWRSLLTGDGLEKPMRQMRHALRLLPAHERCKFCKLPVRRCSRSRYAPTGTRSIQNQHCLLQPMPSCRQ
jgi:hypothetical protein